MTMPPLRVLTNSEVKAYRRCPRYHRLRYSLAIAPREHSLALRFGTLVHLGLERWWQALLPRVERERIAKKLATLAATGDARTFHALLLDALADGRSLEAALAAMRVAYLQAPPEAARPEDVFDLVKAEALLVGYDVRWSEQALDVLGVEVQFRTPLINPGTGSPSRLFVLGGKIDALARCRETGHVFVVEHKTSSESFDEGSFYRRRLVLDNQLSTYFAAARTLGYEPVACLYDVIGKPTIRPHKATPPEERSYTQARYKACPECRRKRDATPPPHTFVLGDPADQRSVACEDDPEGGPRRLLVEAGGRLYSNQRAVDEEPEQYRERLQNAIAAAPERYFARWRVARLDQDLEEHELDLWQTAHAIRRAELCEQAPKNSESCFAYGRPCDFAAVCTHEARLDDPTLFQRLPSPHPELEE